jgi:hypothetical protein
VADSDETTHEFAHSATHLARTLQTVHVTLSQMADQKASILMGAAFVTFTLAVGQARNGSTSVALVVLAAFAFVAAVVAVLAIVPSTRAGQQTNLLFFGSFVQLDEDDYVTRLLEVLRSDEAVFTAMARDTYRNGVVLARRKYRLLAWAYRIFLVGLTASFLTFVVELTGIVG